MKLTLVERGVTTKDGSVIPETCETETAPDLNRLLARIAGHDQDACRTLYDYAAPRLLGTLVHFVRRREIAEDLLQEVFFTVWKKADQFDPERGQAMTWLLTIARHKAIDRIRIGQREPVGRLGDVAANPTPADARDDVIDDATRLSIRKCFETLSPELQQTVSLCYDFGLTHEELAGTLDIPLGTAKGRVRRSLEQLRLCLGAA